MKTTPSRKDRVGRRFIGIDYHKRYSTYCVVDGEGEQVARGRIDHSRPEAFVELVEMHRPCSVVLEVTMNWQWLYEILETCLKGEEIVVANPYKLRIISEAQTKTDKVDAGKLAMVLRSGRKARKGLPWDESFDQPFGDWRDILGTTTKFERAFTVGPDGVSDLHKLDRYGGSYPNPHGTTGGFHTHWTNNAARYPSKDYDWAWGSEENNNRPEYVIRKDVVERINKDGTITPFKRDWLKPGDYGGPCK